jgi:enamine deaminase RidA (YjgF/YER057c/UK114 family)
MEREQVTKTCPLTDYLRKNNLADTELSAPLANYRPSIVSGSHLFISGQGPTDATGSAIIGKLGATLKIDEGQQAAALCALNILRVVRAQTGSCDAIKQIVQLNGYVNATPEFTEHPQVINGASNLMVEILGDRGAHSRAAIGTSSLPLGWAVEISAIVELAT